MRGYYGIGIENPNNQENIGTLFRSAYAFGADFVYTVGHKYREQASDTTKATRNVPNFFYPTIEDLIKMKPSNSVLVGIEIVEGARFLKQFIHPEQCIYLLGSEFAGLSKEALAACNTIVKLPSRVCLNVSTVGSIILYDRIAKSEEEFGMAKKRALITE